MREIPLSRGYVALVDDEDYERLSKHKWHVYVNKRGKSSEIYAKRNIPAIGGKWRYRTIYMHVEITGYPQTDHIDRNGLNNQRSNLRPATSSQNNANRSKAPGKSSIYLGVSWNRECRKWMCSLGRRDNRKYLGLFLDEADAATAYNFAAYELFGEFASFNTPPTPTVGTGDQS